MSEKIEQLEEQIAELEQQVENLFVQLAESKELIAEEALLAGYELGYLQAVVNRTEKELFVEQASNSFNDVMAAPEALGRESLADLLTEIDTFDDVFVSDLEEAAPAAIQEEVVLMDDSDVVSAEEFTHSEVIAAVKGWLNHGDQAVVKNAEVEHRQEELELA